MAPKFPNVIAAVLSGFAIAILIAREIERWPASDFVETISAIFLVLSMTQLGRCLIKNPRAVGKPNAQRKLPGSVLSWVLIGAPSLAALGYLTKPTAPYAGEEYDQAIESSFEFGLAGLGSGEVIYLGIGIDGDPPDRMLAALNARRLGRLYLPWSTGRRSAGQIGVAQEDAKAGLLEDYLFITQVSFPFWRIAVTRLQTSACTGTIVLAQWGHTWYPISLRWDACV